MEKTAIVFWLDISLYLKKKNTLGCVVWGDTIIVMIMLVFLMYRLVHLFVPFRAPGIGDPRVSRVVPRVSHGIPNFWLIFLFIHGMQSQWQSLNFIYFIFDIFLVSLYRYMILFTVLYWELFYRATCSFTNKSKRVLVHFNSKKINYVYIYYYY